MSSNASLPPTMRALVFRDDKLSVEQVPTPEITGGSVILKLLSIPASSIVTARSKAMPVPPAFTLGSTAVGRVVATSLTPGQLLLVDEHIRARDAPNDANILLGLTQGFNEKSARLMASSYLNSGTCGEYTRIPLENAHPVDEALLCGQLGCAVEDINYISTAAVAYGGLHAIEVQAGETVIVAPATGHFSGAAVKNALAMGARVIAVSRNSEAMETLKAAFGPSERLVTVVSTGNVEETTSAIIKANHGRPADAFFDISPPPATGSPHIRSCINALRVRGRVALMGVAFGQLPVSYLDIMLKQLTARGTYMYEREEFRDVIKLVENGLLTVGQKGGLRTVGRYKMEDFEEALEKTEKRFALTELV